MRHEIRTAAAAAPAGAYSQGIRVGNLVFTAGMGPIDPVTGKVAGETIEEQTELTLDNLSAVLEEAGAGLDHVIKATVHLRDLSDFTAFNRVYERRFGDPKPVRTTVGSDLRGIMVEIDLVAVVPSSARRLSPRRFLPELRRPALPELLRRLVRSRPGSRAE